MDGIEKITGRIIGDAEQESARVLEGARHDAEEIVRSFEKLCEQARRDILERGRLEAEEHAARLIGAARQEARKHMLSGKQTLLDRAFDAALERLLGLPEEQYVDLLARLAVRASRNGSEQVIFNLSDRARFGKKAVIEANRLLESEKRPAALTLSEQTRPIKGGLVLADGKIEMNCTLETILRTLRTDAAADVAGILFS